MFRNLNNGKYQLETKVRVVKVSSQSITILDEEKNKMRAVEYAIIGRWLEIKSLVKKSIRSWIIMKWEWPHYYLNVAIQRIIFEQISRQMVIKASRLAMNLTCIQERKRELWGNQRRKLAKKQGKMQGHFNHSYGETWNCCSKLSTIEKWMNLKWIEGHGRSSGPISSTGLIGSGGLSLDNRCQAVHHR